MPTEEEEKDECLDCDNGEDCVSRTETGMVCPNLVEAFCKMCQGKIELTSRLALMGYCTKCSKDIPDDF